MSVAAPCTERLSPIFDRAATIITTSIVKPPGQLPHLRYRGRGAVDRKRGRALADRRRHVDGRRRAADPSSARGPAHRTGGVGARLARLAAAQTEHGIGLDTVCISTTPIPVR